MDDGASGLLIRPAIAVNRIKRHNAFCAGAKAYRKSILDTLAKILPPEAMVDMTALADNTLKQPEFIPVPHCVETAQRKIKQRKKK